MNYRDRPAWRNQWAFITLTGLMLIGYISHLFNFLFGDIGSTEVSAAGTSAGVIFIMTLIFALTIVYRRYSWEFTITTEMVESTNGIIARDIKTIRVKDVRNINLKQSVFQRMFGIGDLEFSSAGGAGIEVTFKGIISPMAIKRRVQGLQGHT